MMDIVGMNLNAYCTRKVKFSKHINHHQEKPRGTQTHPQTTKCGRAQPQAARTRTRAHSHCIKPYLLHIDKKRYTAWDTPRSLLDPRKAVPCKSV